MSSNLVISPFFTIGIALGAFGAILIFGAIAALVQARLLRFALRTLAGLLLLAMGALASTIAFGIQGYRALTREEVAAQISVQPAGAQRFEATFRFPDGREAVFPLAGDEIYIDAHILKWKPLANVLGLHTAYELDRVAGRYEAIQQERSSVRTIYSLSEEKPVDLFSLRQRYAFLAPLLDAEYGSATFVSVNRPAELELRVSTTGLLIRETGTGPK
ncbi:MAG TPA: hypothetical protein VEG37_08950 [Burkholderiales bacterium]|nr:hypothetical protein [Burkholderiales bacterium]